jgi:hypothetical protein
MRHRSGDLDGALAEADALIAETTDPAASLAAHRARVYLLADAGRADVAAAALAMLDQLAPGSPEAALARMRVADLGAPMLAPEPIAGPLAKADSDARSLGIRPNPASGVVVLDLEIETPSEVRVSVHDVLGREVAVPLAGRLEAGRHPATLDASRQAPGVYLVRVSTREGDLAPQIRMERLTIVR